MLHPPHLWGKGVSIVLIGFMDGSGTHTGSRVIAIAGFIGVEDEMLALHGKWDEILNDPKYPTRLPEFHMAECVHPQKEMVTGRWKFADRLTLYGSLCDLLTSSQVRPIGASVITESFQQISAEDLALLSQDNVSLGTPLDVCFHMIVQQIIRAVNELGSDETIGVIFDQDNKDKERKFSEMCDHYMSSYYLGDLFAGYGFVDSKKLNPIQAADLLAYGTMHLAKTTEYPNDPQPDFPVLPPLMRILNKFAEAPETSPLGTKFNLSDLRKLIDKVKRGEMLPKKGTR